MHPTSNGDFATKTAQAPRYWPRNVGNRGAATAPAMSPLGLAAACHRGMRALGLQKISCSSNTIWRQLRNLYTHDLSHKLMRILLESDPWHVHVRYLHPTIRPQQAKRFRKGESLVHGRLTCTKPCCTQQSVPCVLSERSSSWCRSISPSALPS